jgi:Uma2 family endonuclease
MKTARVPDGNIKMATVTLPTEERTVLQNVSWPEYEEYLREYEGRRIRLTYDRGSLEIMILSLGHEGFSYLLGRFVDVLTEELNIPVKAGRSTTFKREELERGLEADNCYWIQHERAMRGKRQFDGRRDPPPDLALETDITSSSLNRMAIYAALKVPEVWRFNGTSLLVYVLVGGKYEVRDCSAVFPFLPLAKVLRLLKESENKDETSLVRSFRAWVRKGLLPGWQATRKRLASSGIPPRTAKKTGTASRPKRKSSRKQENGQGA